MRRRLRRRRWNLGGPMVVHFGNVYIHNKTPMRALRMLAAGRPDVIVINEGGRAVTLAGRLNGYRVHRAKIEGTAKGRTDVLVLTRRDLKVLSVSAVQVMPKLKKIAAWHDRHMVTVIVEHPTLGNVAVIGIHPSPAPKVLVGHDASNPLVRMYATALRRAADHAASLTAQGYGVVVAGDVQLKPNAPARPWSPDTLLAGAGLDVAVHQHLDLIATNLPVASASTLAPAGYGTGSDHPFLRVVLVKKARR